MIPMQTLKTDILKEGLLTSAEWESCAQWAQTCNTLGLQVPLANIILEKFGARPMLWETLLWIFITAQQPDAWQQGQVPWISPEQGEKLAAQFPEQFTVQEIPPLVQQELERMGLSLSIAEFLLATGKLQWEQVKPLLGGAPVNYTPPCPRIHIGSPPHLAAPTDLGALALATGLISAEEYEQCQALQAEFAAEIDLPMEVLLHERLLIDRDQICSLQQQQVQGEFQHLIDQLKRRRLTPEGEEQLKQAIRQNKWLAPDELVAVRSLQTTLEQEHGLRLSLAQLLILQGRLTDEQLQDLNLPYQETATQLEREFKCYQAKRSLGDIILANQIVTPRELAVCLTIQQRCESQYDLKIKLGEILLAKGHIDLLMLQALLATQQYLEIKFKLDCQLVHFAPPENTAILERLNSQGRITPALLGQCVALQKRLLAAGLSWSLSKILLARKVISWQDVADIIALRKVMPSNQHLVFPRWIKHAQAERRLANLAVANRYLTPEEQAHCLALQQYCAQRWGVHLPLALLFLKKGYLSMMAINTLFMAQQAYQLYSDWHYQVRTLALSRDEEVWLTERLQRHGFLDSSVLQACERLQQQLQNEKLALNLAKIMAYSRKIPTWVLQAAIQEQHATVPDFVHLPISRAPDERKVTPDFQLDARKWEETVLFGILFGQIAVEEGYLSQENLQIALRQQQYLREMGLKIKLGELLVFMKWLPATAIKPILQQQARQLLDLVWPEGTGLSPEDAWLRNLLTERKLLPPTEIERCVFIQQKLASVGISKSLYQVVCQRKILPPETITSLDEALLAYRRQQTPQQSTVDMAIATLEQALRTASTRQPELAATVLVTTSATRRLESIVQTPETVPATQEAYSPIPALLKPAQVTPESETKENFSFQEALISTTEDKLEESQLEVVPLADSDVIFDFGDEDFESQPTASIPATSPDISMQTMEKLEQLGIEPLVPSSGPQESLAGGEGLIQVEPEGELQEPLTAIPPTDTTPAGGGLIQVEPEEEFEQTLTDALPPTDTTPAGGGLIQVEPEAESTPALEGLLISPDTRASAASALPPTDTTPAGGGLIQVEPEADSTTAPEGLVVPSDISGSQRADSVTPAQLDATAGKQGLPLSQADRTDRQKKSSAPQQQAADPQRPQTSKDTTSKEQEPGN